MSRPSKLERLAEDAIAARNGAAHQASDSPCDTPIDPPAEPGILLSTVQPQRVDWLWPGRIPLGKLTILDGDPGLGKSVLTLELAARVSRGDLMPFEATEPGDECDPGGVLLLSAEDGLDDTIVPRLVAANADLDRCLSLSVIPDVQGGERLLQLPDDAHVIAEGARRMKARLIVVDPLTAFLGTETNTHKDSDCRRAFWPLAKVAEETGAAVVTVRHLNKAAGGSPIYRGGGSIAIIGAARSGLLVARDPDNPDLRVLATTKCNLAKEAASLSFSLESHAATGALRIRWGGPSAQTAASLLAVPRDEEDRGALQEAAEVLTAILVNGPKLEKEVQAEARKASISGTTLRRAKRLLRVKSQKNSFTGAWLWELPERIA